MALAVLRQTYWNWRNACLPQGVKIMKSSLIILLCLRVSLLQVYILDKSAIQVVSSESQIIHLYQIHRMLVTATPHFGSFKAPLINFWLTLLGAAAATAATIDEFTVLHNPKKPKNGERIYQTDIMMYPISKFMRFGIH
jgi:hypothetical protein